jgi:hypothetical protein
MDIRVYSVEEVRVEGLDASPPAIAVSARGQVNSTGWTNPRLVPWTYVTPPADGIVDLDFIATAPDGFANFVFCPVAVAFAFSVPDWLKGVRVHASTSHREAGIDANWRPAARGPAMTAVAIADGTMRPTGEGMPLPWPFPWLSPARQQQQDRPHALHSCRHSFRTKHRRPRSWSSKPMNTVSLNEHVHGDISRIMEEVI